MNFPFSIAHYEVTALIGSGGMGAVYRARDTKLGREVALKMLPSEMADDPDRLARFQREARAVAALNHPNIVTLYSVEEYDAQHFLTMELVEGQPLDQLIPKEGLPVDRILEIADGIAQALTAAHDKGLVHRDLKPANVMIATDSGRVKVLDFGLARDLLAPDPTGDSATSMGRTQPGVAMGTPPYMSPEQILGREVDQRTDIFSLGVLLHEMTTGRRPFQGATSVEVAAAILRDNPPPLTSSRNDLPVQLTSLIQQCLAKDAGQRIQTARLVGDALRQARGSGTEMPPVAATEGFWVAVLPFKYKGSDGDIEALADGLSEEIIAGLARFSYLRVIARSSTARYAREATDVRTAGKELGARYVMEGSLRQAGSRIRVAVQVVDATTGAQLWAETYERAFTPETIFEVQDELVPCIVSSVADAYGVLTRSMSEVLRKRGGSSFTPHEAVLRGFGYGISLDAEEHAEVRSILEAAVAASPGHSNCQAMLSIMYVMEYAEGFNPLPDALGRAYAAARRAVDAGPTNHMAHYALASALYFRKDLLEFRPVAERAIALNPMNGSTLAFMGLLIAYSGDWDHGCAVVERVPLLNPFHPAWYRFAAFHNAYRKGDYQAALDVAVKIDLPGYFFTYVVRAAALGQLGQRDAARKVLKDLLTIRPNIAAEVRELMTRWHSSEAAEHLMDGLRKAGLEIEGISGKTVLSPR